MIPDDTNLFEYWETVNNLIIYDLKIYLYRSTNETRNRDILTLELNIDESIFVLMGFRKKQITPSLREWYHFQSDKILTIDTTDESNVKLLASDIFFGLNQMRTALKQV